MGQSAITYFGVSSFSSILLTKPAIVDLPDATGPIMRRIRLPVSVLLAAAFINFIKSWSASRGLSPKILSLNALYATKSSYP